MTRMSTEGEHATRGGKPALLTANFLTGNFFKNLAKYTCLMFHIEKTRSVFMLKSGSNSIRKHGSRPMKTATEPLI